MFSEYPLYVRGILNLQNRNVDLYHANTLCKFLAMRHHSFHDFLFLTSKPCDDMIGAIVAPVRLHLNCARPFSGDAHECFFLPGYDCLGTLPISNDAAMIWCGC